VAAASPTLTRCVGHAVPAPTPTRAPCADHEAPKVTADAASGAPTDPAADAPLFAFTPRDLPPTDTRGGACAAVGPPCWGDGLLCTGIAFGEDRYTIYTGTAGVGGACGIVGSACNECLVCAVADDPTTPCAPSTTVCGDGDRCLGALQMHVGGIARGGCRARVDTDGLAEGAACTQLLYQQPGSLGCATALRCVIPGAWDADRSVEAVVDQLRPAQPTPGICTAPSMRVGDACAPAGTNGRAENEAPGEPPLLCIGGVCVARAGATDAVAKARRRV